jgi:hypothetical protein
MTSGYREDEEAANERRANRLGGLVGGTVGLSCFAATTYFEEMLKPSMGLSNGGYRVFEWVVVLAVLIGVTRLLNAWIGPRAN